MDQFSYFLHHSVNARTFDSGWTHIITKVLQMNGYRDVVSKLKSIDSFIYSERRSGSFSSLFFVKGCRFHLTVFKTLVWDISNDIGSKPKIYWHFKTFKFKNTWINISLGEVLESKYMSKNGKTDILFDLNLFSD